MIRRVAKSPCATKHAFRRASSSTNSGYRAAAARDAIAAAAGAPPKGWCGQDFNESWDTPAILAEAGFDYTTDWTNDDRPFLLGPYGGKTLVALPPQAEWGDLDAMWIRRVSAPAWADGLAEAFHVLHAEGGGVFNLTLHPWIAGQPHRIRYLRDALTRIMGLRGIWKTTTDDLAAAARPQLG